MSCQQVTVTLGIYTRLKLCKNSWHIQTHFSIFSRQNFQSLKYEINQYQEKLLLKVTLKVSELRIQTLFLQKFKA